MCPVCIANLALMITGAASTGGITAFAVKKLYARRRGGQTAPKNQPAPNHEQDHE